MFYQLARYFLFKLDPEVAHELSIKQLSLLGGTPLDIFLNHRQELQAAGVDVPPVSMLMDYLVQRGLPVSRSVITTEEAAKAIEKALGEMKTTNAHSADSAKSSQEVSHAE